MPVVPAAAPRQHEQALSVIGEVFGLSRDRLGAYDWMRSSGAGRILLAQERGRPLAAGAAVSFGATGWLAGITVRRRARRRGLGTAITEAAMAWLTQEGARTILLLATAGGRHVYEPLGFEPEGRYLVLAARGTPGDVSADVRPLRGADRAAILDLDRWATAEDRAPALDACLPRGLGAPGGETLRAAAVGCPWPAGHAVARDPAAGTALLDALWRDAGSSFRAVVPEANAEAIRALRERGFREVDHVVRMRRGAPVAWRPDGIWGAFNLAWG